MSLFRDKTGREWNCHIDVGTVKRVKSLTGFNLATCLEGRPPKLFALIDDIVELVDVIYVLCKPQCEARGVSDEAFAALLADGIFGEALAAFQQAVVDFFRRHGLEHQKVLAEKLNSLVSASILQAQLKADALDVTSALKAIRSL